VFVLGKFDRGSALMFRRATVDLILNGVAQIDQHLAKTMKPLAGFSGILRMGPCLGAIMSAGRASTASNVFSQLTISLSL